MTLALALQLTANPAIAIPLTAAAVAGFLEIWDRCVPREDWPRED
jgi:hypothetical protein